MSIGENIKRIRKEKGLTQKELADKCNLSRSYLADVERNRYNPSLDTLIVIAKNLDIKVSTLLGENEEFDYDSIRISRIARHAFGTIHFLRYQEMPSSVDMTAFFFFTVSFYII